MTLATSADGTSIAFHEVGDGPAIIIVNGAFSTANDAAAIADAFAARGLRAVTYDRRARGDSGDTHPVDHHREVEDLSAVITAVGGEAIVIGHSSGAILGLFAASGGAPISGLYLSEPPFHFGQNDPDPALPERLQAMVDAGRPGDAVETFQREAVGLGDEVIAQIKASGMAEALEPLAQSTVYDVVLTRALSTPTSEMLDVACPVTILCGVQTFPFLAAAARRLSVAMPSAEFLEVPESVGHRLDAEAAARIVAERMPG